MNARVDRSVATTRKVILTSLSMLVVVLGSFLAMRPAQAAVQPMAPAATQATAAVQPSAAVPLALSDCPATNFCVWVNSNYNNGPGKFAGDNSDWTKFSHASCPSGTWNNCASSGYNNGTSGKGVEVYQFVGHGGDTACLPRGWHNANFANLVWPGTNDSFNDSISGNLWTTLC